MPIGEYDNSSESDILRHSRQLIGHTLRQVTDVPEQIANDKHKGRIGNLVEEYFFGIKPNSIPAPDFPRAGIELKVTGLKARTKGDLQAKERLVLNMINYSDIVLENFETSSLVSKCGKILILCYEYDKSKSSLDQRFTDKQFVYRLLAQDAEVIRNDWQTIQKKVLEGKAHELSEGDTFYLKANRKGSGGEKEKPSSQPFSKTPAMRRSFSLSSTYLTSIIDKSQPNDGSLNLSAGQSIEEATQERIGKYVGRTTTELIEAFELSNESGQTSKSIRHTLITKMLSNGNSSVKELKLAGIQVKTIRLKHDGRTRESMSFSPFDYKELMKHEWEDSEFLEVLERKFLLAIFQDDSNGVEHFSKLAYWNMPYDDRLQAQEVWEETKARIEDGTYIFPQASATAVAHVRPHGRNAADTIECPDGVFRGKKSFWLNQKYIEKVVSSL
jgi:DNA mismatch repair protein MutH